MDEILEYNILNDDKLISLIKENFNEDDNKLFELSFKLYTLTKSNSDDFIISLDDIYKWVGFSTKGDSKRLLINKFEENKDYKIVKGIFSRSAKNSYGCPVENIFITIDCFKIFCMKADTKQADNIYKYYIKMEKIIFKYIEEKYKEQTNIIQQNKQLLEDKNKLIEQKDIEINKIKNQKYDEIEKNEYIYVLSTDKHDVYKIGETKRPVEKRRDDLQTACVDDIQILHICKTSNKKVVELLVHNLLDRYRYNPKREHFQTKLAYIINLINISEIFYDLLKSTYENRFIKLKIYNF
jgi:hypothetical protein